MTQNVKEKIEQAERFMLMLWTFFLTILYVCSFLTEYRFPIKQEEIVVGEKILEDLQKLFFFALMGLGFLIDLVRMRKDKNNAFVFLFLTLLLGGLSGGIGALQAQFVFYVTGEG